MVYPKIGHMKEYFSPLLHPAHNSDRRTVLFSRTSFYRIKVTSLPHRHAPSSLLKMKICCFKNKGGIFNIFASFTFPCIVMCINLLFVFFMSICIHNIITDLEILVQEHLLGKKSLLRSWIDVVPQLRQSAIEHIRK